MPKEKRDAIVQRIRKLLALGKGQGEEADAARQLAAKLTRQHAVTPDELSDDESGTDEIVIKGKRFKSSWRMILWKVITLPLSVALMRRTDDAGGGTRVILHGRLDLCRESKYAYRYFENAIVELALKQPEALASPDWRKDFCRGVAECIKFRWKEHVRTGERKMGAPLPPAPPPPLATGPSEQIFIEPLKERIAAHVGMKLGNDIPMPPKRKRKKKTVKLEPHLLPPVDSI